MAVSQVLKQLILQAVKLKDELARKERLATEARENSEQARNAYRECLTGMYQEAVRDRPAVSVPYRIIEVAGVRYLLKLDPSANYCEVGEVAVEV